MGLSAIALPGLEQSEAQAQTALTNLATFGSSSPSNVPPGTTGLISDITELSSAQDQYSLSLDVMNIANNIEKGALNIFA